MMHPTKSLRRTFAVIALVLGSVCPGGAKSVDDGLLYGAIIGTPGSWDNNPWVAKDAVFDGNPQTYFDAVRHDDAWVGLDLGKGRSARITKVGYCPRTDDDVKSWFSFRMVGGVFQGANAPDFSDAVDLFTIHEPPAQGKMTVQPVSAPGSFRYVRYLSPAGGNGNVAELEFYGESLGGVIIGTPGSWEGNPGCAREAAFDRRTDTFFDAPYLSGAWVGLDLKGKKVRVTKVGFYPRKDDDAKSGFSRRMVGGKFQGANTPDFKDAVDLFVIARPPAQDEWTEVTITQPTPFGYLRYLSPERGSCNVAELEFCGE